MSRIFLILLIILSLTGFNKSSQDELIRLKTSVNPKVIRQGQEGELSIKIIPTEGIRISSNPDIRINFNKNENIQFSKVFFTGAELDYNTIQEDNFIFYKFDEEEKSIRFKVKDTSLTGKQRLNGEVIFTAIFKDKWSVKTFQKFSAGFTSRKSKNLKKR
ncbi:MAG: hypothetical protein ABFR75_00070 [Acidobacteriota bacterium]